MKHILLITFCLNLYSVNAQSWFENHPAWTNSYSAGWGGPGWEYMSVGKDTLIDGLPSVVLDRFFDMEFINDFTGRRFVRQSGDTLFFWGEDSTFHVMYNLALGTGDSVSIPLLLSNTTLTYTIDSVGQLDISGNSLRFQRITLPNYYINLSCTGLIIEKIGMINGTCYNPATGDTFDNALHFFPDEINSGVIDGPDWVFCRFKNDQMEYLSAHPWCADLTGVENPELESPSYSIVPNPFQDQFSLVAPAGRDDMESLRLFDITGKALPVKRTPGSNRVETGYLLPGVYMLEITGKNRQRQMLLGIKH